MKPIVYAAVFFLFTSLFISCTKPQQPISASYQLSDITDSVIYEELKFGITRNDLVKKQKGMLQQNIMSEPVFDTDVVEVESGMDIKGHYFKVYYYFDLQDSLYRVKAEFRIENRQDYEDACKEVGNMLYIPYGVPERLKTSGSSYKFSWVLKNKEIIFECGCFYQNCLLEVMITELRLFIKNRDRKQGSFNRE